MTDGHFLRKPLSANKLRKQETQPNPAKYPKSRERLKTFRLPNPYNSFF